MNVSMILIIAGWVIFGLSTVNASTTTNAEVSSVKTAAAVATRASLTSPPHLNTSSVHTSPYKTNESVSTVSMIGFSTTANKSTENSTMNTINNSTSDPVEMTTVANTMPISTSDVNSTSTATAITSAPNVTNSLKTLTSSIVTKAEILKTESTKAVITSGKITKSTATRMTKLMPSTFKVLVSSAKPQSSTKKTFTRQHQINHGQHKKDPQALSSGSVAAIVIGFIAIVLILLGGAYYFKMRRSSYGRLLDETDHSSMGNFFNPMFDG